MDAIKAVAKEAGYAYVLDVNSLIVAPPADDIIGLVKKKLNIKDPAPAAPAKTTPKTN
ncbi:MAG: OmpH family outer membrane protein [Chitinophagaceae bacterium]|nr:OmpH family outer membrane protein [Chitinophagaceae bacterium]